MKIRQGFVSNSSSSSFIIARAQVGDEAWKKFSAYLDENKSDFYIQVRTNNYVMLETSDGGPDEEFLEEIGISDSDYATWYG